MLYNYDITPKAVERIVEFYAHVVLKYQHTFSFDDMEKSINRAVFNAGKIEQAFSRRKPTLTRWKGLHMAKAGKLYYAYTINGNTITIEDACHAQNMHEGNSSDVEEF
jgi:hypothetical protein